MERSTAFFSVRAWVWGAVWAGTVAVVAAPAIAQPPATGSGAENDDPLSDDDDVPLDPEAEPGAPAGDTDDDADDASDLGDEGDDTYGVGATVEEDDATDGISEVDEEDFFDEDDPWAEVEAPGADELDEEFGGPPINFDLNGYARMRLVHLANTPVFDPSTRQTSDAADAGFGFMRARFNPTISYGDPENPDIALKMQIDLLDNVVFGDNARLQGTPLFAENPSATALVGADLFGPGDINDVFVRRLWLEMNVLIGQLRIGRQGSQGGLGILFNDGNGFRNDFGDALTGTTFDRILFLTRPMTVANALAGKGAEPTPLVWGLGFDWLVEDPILRRSDLPTFTPTPDPETDPENPPPTAPVDYPPGAFRSDFPYDFLADGTDDVNQAFMVLAWLDPDFNDEVNPDDELTIGSVWLYRYQSLTRSNIFIGDVFYKLRYSFGEDTPWLYTEGEFYSILGQSRGVSLIGDFDEGTGRTDSTLTARVWGGAIRAGVEDPTWSSILEAGFSTGQPGQGVVGASTFRQRANNPNYIVGLLLYPVVLAGRTAHGLGQDIQPLWSRGGVWNSKYWLPKIKFRPFDGLEIVTQVVMAWADHLNGPLVNTRQNPDEDTACGVFQRDCFLGWEWDLAIKLDAGENDNIRWSTELGLMNAGPALADDVTGVDGSTTTLGLRESFLWTLQSRVAFVY